MKKTILAGLAALSIVVATSGQAQAATITLTPASVGIISGATLTPPTGPANCEPECVEAAFGLAPGTIADTDLLFKADVGDVNSPATIYSGSFAGSYTTTFANTAFDPADATISWKGLPFSSITCGSCYLAIKDGNHDPTYYFYNLGLAQGTNPVWDGVSDIVMTGFWSGPGAISHVAIWGVSEPVTGGDRGGSIPEPTTLALFGAALALVGSRLRRRT